MRKPKPAGTGPGKGKPFKKKENSERRPRGEHERGTGFRKKSSGSGARENNGGGRNSDRRKRETNDEGRFSKREFGRPAERSGFEKNKETFSGRRRQGGHADSLGEDQFAGARRNRRDFNEKPDRKFEREKGPFKKDDRRRSGENFSGDKYQGRESRDRGFAERRGKSRFENESQIDKGAGSADQDGVKRVRFGDFEDGKVFSNAVAKKTSKGKTKYKKQTAKLNPQTGDGLIRLNKYLSNAGVASRRDADTLIQSGVVKVNGVVIDQLGYKINPGDKVTYGDAPVKGERKVYLLLNKPKDYITTVEDPRDRKTVMELVSKACKERIYPVGRLDRNTTGLLLFTNDGELTTRLTHPKFGVKKVYHVSLNKGLKPEDFKAIAEGIELEDGIIKADDIAFVGEGKKEIGIEIHSGRNRIVRRIFEHLGYDVLKLDRVVFAGLTKKDLPRGKHRFLTAKEISFLQMIG